MADVLRRCQETISSFKKKKKKLAPAVRFFIRLVLMYILCMYATYKSKIYMIPLWILTTIKLKFTNYQAFKCA